MLSLLPASLRILLSLFFLNDPTSRPPTPTPTPTLRFELRHEHAVSLNTSRTIFRDVRLPPSDALAFTLDQSGPLHLDLDSDSPYTVYEARTRRATTHRPSSFAAFTAARRHGRDLLLKYGHDRNHASANLTTSPVDWDPVEVVAPDIGSRRTLQVLAMMANNAYSEPGDKDWYDLPDGWNVSYPFGWEPDADGFRGHVFATEDNSTVVVSIKGTSAGWLVGGGGPTVKKDKLNDNLLFSCCCARVGPTWSPVCGCYRGGGKCDQDCLEQSLTDDSSFYQIGTNLYNNITYMYPNSNVWLIGHSLGGSLAALLGATFGAPTVGFETPPERLAARRLHLPSPPNLEHITHVYHTADPLAQGTCTGMASTCALAGYAMESRCHQGKLLRYDTITKLGWAVDIRTHGISVIVEKLLAEDWDDESEVPPLVDEDEDCVDCFDWDFGDYPEGGGGGGKKLLECAAAP